MFWTESLKFRDSVRKNNEKDSRGEKPLTIFLKIAIMKMIQPDKGGVS
jgi:hypothetical protein